MTRERVYFDGQAYTLREIEDKNGDTMLVAPVSLWHELRNLWASEEAQSLDEEICYYVDDIFIDESDEELRRVLHEEYSDVF